MTVAIARVDGGDEDLTVSPAALTFTTANWNAAQTVTARAAADADAKNGKAEFTLTLTGDDPNPRYTGYAGLAVDPLVASEVDRDAGSATFTPSTLEMEDGGSGTYTVVLGKAPGAAVTIRVTGSEDSDTDLTASPAALTFTTGNWTTAQTVTVASALDDDTADDEAVFHHLAESDDVGYDEVDLGRVTATATDRDEAGIVVSTANLVVPEDATATYNIVLKSRPSAPVTITTTSSDPRFTVSPAALTFAPLRWDIAQDVTVAAEDDRTQNTVSGTVSHAASSGDNQYDGTTVASVALKMADNDGTRRPPALEGLTASAGDGGVSLSWDDPQNPGIVGYRVAWIATADCDTRFGCSHSLGRLRVEPKKTKTPVPDSGAGTTSHTVTGLTNGVAYAFTVFAVDGSGRESADIKSVPTATPTAGVPGQPTGLVAVPDDRAVRLAWDDPGNADITSWQVSTRPAGSPWPANGGWTAIPDSSADTTRHTVTGLDNGRRYDFRIRAATSAGTGLFSGIVSASPLRTGAGVRFSHVLVEVPEAGEAAYTVTLTARPTADVTVAIAADDDGDVDLTVAPDSLTFTTANWEAGQAVTLSAAEDDDAVDGTAVFVHRLTSDDDNYAGMELRLRAHEDDVDTAGVTVTAASLTVAEGGVDPASWASWTVALESKPVAPVTIHVARAADGDADLSVVPAALTFTAADWETAQTVTVRAAEDDDAIDGSASFLHRATSAEEGYQGIEIASVAVTEVDNDSPGVTVTAASNPLPVDEGKSTSWTVVLVTEPGAPVTVSVAREAGGDAGAQRRAGRAHLHRGRLDERTDRDRLRRRGRRRDRRRGAIRPCRGERRYGLSRHRDRSCRGRARRQ